MPIDSLCSGCGKTLRVNDEFIGRKARCPVCGTIYIAGGPLDENKNPMDVGPVTILGEPSTSSADIETTYAKPQDVPAASVKSSGDSWSSMPTAKPLADPTPQPQAVEPAATLPSLDPSAASPSEPSTFAAIPNVAPPQTMYFVRTPNSMIYGPSNAQTVHEWIAQGRLDDTCHIREAASEQWLGIPAWRFQCRTQLNPITNPSHASSNQFGSVPVSSVQSVGYTKSGNGLMILILGLVSWILCPTFIGALVCSLIAIVFAMTELKKIREGTSPQKEKALVLVGLFISVANLIAISVTIIVIVALAILNP